MGGLPLNGTLLPPGTVVGGGVTQTCAEQAAELDVLPVVTILCAMATSGCPMSTENPIAIATRATRANGVLLRMTPRPEFIA